MNRPFDGSLFAEDFLREAITRLPDWELDHDGLAEIESALRGLFDRFPTDLSPNESQTEDDLIWPVLARLGWTAGLKQQNLSAFGRQDVPDGLLFPDDASKDRANRLPEEWRRYEHGLAVVESKRWLRPLDRRSGRRGEESAPSTQMLRYLRRIDDLTTGALRWGILTNGALWRLYWARARSVSEQFFELDLASVLGIGEQGDWRVSPPRWMRSGRNRCRKDRRIDRLKRLDPAERMLGHGLRPLPGESRGLPGRPRHRGPGRGRGARGGVPVAAGRANRRSPQHDHGEREGQRLDIRSGPAQ